ncbi:uncharacterized protein YALI1_C31793g [Yarrowia lipolytica]|uniref:Uncharacterized protein n=1 Tax=Yarrowia lipolytica TaxID=4952 RepID=A0A1D8NCD1_YARLL|nr:hypothetical protein YALI1_C31793g [Yarrowia lipolytica]
MTYLDGLKVRLGGNTHSGVKCRSRLYLRVRRMVENVSNINPWARWSRAQGGAGSRLGAESYHVMCRWSLLTCVDGVRGLLTQSEISKRI